jgi:hypothetical protein
MVLLRRESGALRRKNLAAARRIGLICLCCIAATLVTPYGWHVYHNFTATLTNKTAMDLVSEWTSPDFHDIFGRTFEGMLVIILFGLLRTRLPRDPVEIVVILGLTHIGLASSRNIPLFALVATPMAARHIQSALTDLLSRASARPSGTDDKGRSAAREEPSLFGTAPSLVSVAAVAMAFAFIPILRLNVALDKSHCKAPGILDRIACATIVLDSFPEGACKFLADAKVPSTLKLFNTYDIGGFLIWRIPEYPVFIDGRADVYFDTTLQPSMDIKRLRFDWEERLDRYGVELAVIPSRDPLAHLFMDSPNWSLVYADRPYTAKRSEETTDDAGLVFIKRSPHTEAVIAHCLQVCPAARGQQGNRQ